MHDDHREFLLSSSLSLYEPLSLSLSFSFDDG